MATWQHLRSSTANKRPTTSLADGRIAINTNTASPGLFFKDSAGTGIVKVGPVHVGTTAPNSVPAAGGSSGNYTGEQWLDTSVSPAQMKVWNGSTWVGIVADELPVSKLQDGAARQLIQTDAAGTGVEWTSDVDVPGTLDVTSTATFDSIAQHPLGTAGAPTITFTGDNNTGIYSPGADQVAISTAGSGRLFINSSGVVTTDNSFTSGRLNVVNANTVSTFDRMLFLRSNSLSNAFLGLGNDSFYIASAPNAPIVFCTNSDGGASGTSVPTNERLRITSAGLVGVGTSTPSAVLHAVAANDPVLFLNRSASDGEVARFLVGGNTAFSFSTTAGGIRTIDGGNADFRIRTNSADRLTVTSSGNVGVGTTSPTAALNVNAGGTDLVADFVGTSSPYIRIDNGTKKYIAQVIGSDFRIQDQTATAERLRIDSSGRVGIGTSSPGESIHTTGKLRVGDGGNYTVAAVQLGSSNANGISYPGTNILNFITNSTAALTIDASQRVGIGTTSPARTLHVAGSAVFADTVDTTVWAQFSTGVGGIGTNNNYPFAFATNGTERARIDSSGRLLVGTSSARSLAGVTANLQIEGTNYNNSSFNLTNNSNDNQPAYLTFGKSRTGSVGGNTVVQNNDNLGIIQFAGADGTDAESFGAAIACLVDGTPGANDMPGRLVFSTTADGASSPTERMRISSNGNFLLTSNAVTIAPSSGTGDFYVQGVNAAGSNARIFLTCPGSNEGSIWYERSTSRLYIYSQSGGVYLGSTATSWTANSDERLKDIVEPIENAADKVSSLRAVIGKYKTDEEGTRRSFLIAQDVQAVLPEAVDASNPDSLGVSYTDVIPLLVAAIKEQQAMIAELQAKVAALETK